MPEAMFAVLLLAFCAADAPAKAPSTEPVLLDLARLYVASERGARIAPEVEALRGRRVRARGFMVRMEDPPRGAFFLTRHPVEAEEGGAGTGDLPPGALRVEVSRLRGEEVEWVPDVVEAVGTLEVGRAEDADGRVSWLRVVVDAPRGGRPVDRSSARFRADSPAATKRRAMP